MKLSKLEKLLIGEVSGVDDPANEIPGWMVLKARANASAGTPEGTTLAEKLRGFFGGDEEEIQMTKEELNAELDVRFAALTESLSKSAEVEVTPAEVTPVVAEVVPAVEEAPVAKAEEVPVVAPVVEEAAPAVDTDAIAKAIEDGVAAALQPVLDVIDAVIDRFEPIERALTIRKSADGQEGAEGEAQEPNVGSAIRKALNI